MKTRQQAAEDTVKQLGWENDGTAEANDIKKAFLAGCEFEAKNRWIPVSERLPEKVGAYLTYRSNGITIIEHWDNIRDSDYLWKDCYSVTHWQPLPSPPKPQEL